MSEFCKDHGNLMELYGRIAASLATGNIKSGVTILGVAGAATVRDVSDWTDAVEADVASGKKFYKADGSQATGTA